MALYIGETCPVCKQAFKPEDDIVVCPECGTPYHRGCWAKVGHCVHEAEHAAGFVWQPEAAAAAAVCPNCGAHNPAGAAFCNHCGVPLTAAPQDGQAQGAQGPLYARGPAQAGAAAQAPGAGRMPQGAQPHIRAYTAGQDGGIYRREIGPEDPIDGIKARDWASYVGRSSPYYLMQFFRMSETKRRTGISLSAFLLGPIYFFYRKMWREGTLFTILTVLFAVPNILAMMIEAGVQPLAGWNLSWLPMAVNLSSLASWVMSVVMSLYAVYWYKQTATRNIRAIYARVPEGPARADALALSGGTSILAAALYIVGMGIFSYVLMMLLGPSLQSILSSFTL